MTTHVMGVAMHRRDARATGRDARATGRGFTLVEVLVAVGALGVISVGLATIFAVIGDTVDRGRTVSSLTAHARLVERQMREDFERMTREGFLVIAHQYANEGDPIALHPGQRANSQRQRRADEIMFFRTGDFASAREPLYSGFVPRSKAARIYYGHGERAFENLATQSTYRVPRVDDTNLDSRIGLGINTPGNPNRYAREWTLLRHTTALVGPATTLSDLPPGSTGLDINDSDVQVSLQPAVSSMFRAIAELQPCDWPTGPNPVRGRFHPTFASGIVDVATTDLSEIRAWVTTAIGSQQMGGGQDPLIITILTPADIDNCNDLPAVGGAVVPSIIQKAWMLDSFPSRSQDFEIEGTTLTFPPPYPTVIPIPNLPRRNVPLAQRTRIRYEPGPTDFLGASTPLNPNVASYRVADQSMLSANNFLPRCTEFIVEWSFGKVYPIDPGEPGYDANRAGQMIWHGRERSVNTPSGAVQVATRYGTDNQLVDRVSLAYRLRTPGAQGLTYGSYPVSPLLIHRENTGPTGPTPPVRENVYSYFGYTDPTFDADDPDGNPNTNDAAASGSIAWAWPKLIRVTMAVGHPTDPDIEEVFEFVFEAPGNPVR